MDERIRGLGRTAWSLLGITGVAVVAALIAWYLRALFAPLVLAGIIVFLANPIVSRLHDRGLPRVLGATVFYLGVAAIVGLAGWAISPLVADQFDELSERVPEVREDVEDTINDYHDRSVEQDWLVTIPTVRQITNEASGGAQEDLSDQVTTLRNLGGQLFAVGLILVLGPIVAFYMLIDLPDIGRRARELIPESSRDRVTFIGHRLNQVVGGFFRGQLAVAFIVGVMASVGLAIVDIPLWLVVGMIAGLFNIIPLIGPWIGAIPGVLIGLTSGGLGTAVAVAVVMVVVQQIDNHLITPTVMRRAVALHPAAVVLALLVWGGIGGFIGLLLAVPITATIKVIGGHLWRRYVQGISVPGLDEPEPEQPHPPAAPGAAPSEA